MHPWKEMMVEGKPNNPAAIIDTQLHPWKEMMVVDMPNSPATIIEEIEMVELGIEEETKL